LRAYEADCWIGIQRVDERVQPSRLRHRVVVEEDQRLATRNRCPVVAGRDEAAVLQPPASEFGRNSRYVFALPARYNFAFPKGYEEVEDILNGNPLHAAPNN
jgi:hypothetical protein